MAFAHNYHCSACGVGGCGHDINLGECALRAVPVVGFTMSRNSNQPIANTLTIIDNQSTPAPQAVSVPLPSNLASNVTINPPALSTATTIDNVHQTIRRVAPAVDKKYFHKIPKDKGETSWLMIQKHGKRVTWHW